MIDISKRKHWDGTPMRAAEWNSKYHRRCYLCQRLGEAENYVAGPFKLEDGKHVRQYKCKGGCKKVSTEHLDEGKPPRRESGDFAQPSRNFTLEIDKHKKRRKTSKRALKKDLARMKASKEETKQNSKKWTKKNG